MAIRLGYQIPSFTYPDTPPDQLFDTVVAQAVAAEESGFDTVLLMDHFYQLPGIGSPDQEMLECYSGLAALAMATETVQLSALVTGNTYRNPAMLAKTVTTLDVISKGRAVLGIGAGWFELEHQQYGYEFGTFTDRFVRLEEALQIIQPMLRGEKATFSGEWYTATDAMNNPRVRDDLPIMIGGSGEKKTFRLAATYADELNIICGRSEIPRKLEALAARCAEADRDPATLPTSFLAMVVMGRTHDEAHQLAAAHFAKGGMDWNDEKVRAAMGDRVIAGDPDEVAGVLADSVIGAGIGGLTINMIPNGHDPEMVALAGETLAPLVS